MKNNEGRIRRKHTKEEYEEDNEEVECEEWLVRNVENSLRSSILRGRRSPEDDGPVDSLNLPANSEGIPDKVTTATAMSHCDEPPH